MQIGNVIKKYRKDKNLTQEELAKRLGVTAPAVSKWESGNSLPDISLLSPIARLLNISIETLLAHEKELSDEDAIKLVQEAGRRFKTDVFDDVFQWGKECIAEYPNCYNLILWMALKFESQQQQTGLPSNEKYDAYILNCYERVLESNNAEAKNTAAESLYNFHMNREQYKEAEASLTYFSSKDPKRKQKEAVIYSKTGQQDDAYRMFEELLYNSYQDINTIFNDIYIMALEENDLTKAHMMIKKSRELAHIFELGKYHEATPGLELAVLEKNESETLHIVEQMLTHLDSICDFTKSPLYSHMEFAEMNETYPAEIREDLLKVFRNEKTFEYLKENHRWRDLVGLFDGQ